MLPDKWFQLILAYFYPSLSTVVWPTPFPKAIFSYIKVRLSLLRPKKWPSPAIVYKDRPFAFAVRDDMGRSVNDPQFFSLEFRIMTVITGLHGPEISFEYKTFHKCNGSDTSDANEMALLVDSYCLDNSTILMQGNFGDPFSSLFQINMYQCQNTTENNFSCKSPDEIQNYFNMKSFNLKYHNTILQLKNYEVPSIETLSNVQYKCEVRLNRLVTINMQKAVISTDEGGILGSSVKTQDRRNRISNVFLPTYIHCNVFQF